MSDTWRVVDWLEVDPAYTGYRFHVLGPQHPDTDAIWSATVSRHEYMSVAYCECHRRNNADRFVLSDSAAEVSLRAVLCRAQVLSEGDEAAFLGELIERLDAGDTNVPELVSARLLGHDKPGDWGEPATG